MTTRADQIAQMTLAEQLRHCLIAETWDIVEAQRLMRLAANALDEATLRADREAAPASQPLPDHDNHHNALLCPYCNPKGLKFAEPLEAAPAPPEPCVTCGHVHYFEDENDSRPWGKCRTATCDCRQPTYGAAEGAARPGVAVARHEHDFSEYTVCKICGLTEAAIEGCHHCADFDSIKNGRCWWCLQRLVPGVAVAPKEPA